MFYEHYQELQIGDKCFYVVKEEDILDDENHIEKSKLLKEGKLTGQLLCAILAGCAAFTKFEVVATPKNVLYKRCIRSFQ